MYLCPGEHQHPRQCVPGVGVYKGAPPRPPPELHPAGAGVHVRPATTSMDQPSGVLQVSTFSASLFFFTCRFHLFYFLLIYYYLLSLLIIVNRCIN